MKVFIIFSFVFWTLISGCKDKKAPAPVACTQEARAGLNVKVKDGKTNTVLGDSATVIATEGTYSETLQFFGGSEPSFAGAFERVGTYVITVNRNCYTTYTSAAIIVGKDECHVIPQTIIVSLHPK